ncbi:MAG: M48 family metallopeptidase [Anaerolineae bacterium]
MPIDSSRQEQAKEYARIRHRLFAGELVLSTGALLVVLLSGLSVWLRNLITGISPDPWVSTALYFIAGVLGYGALTLPLSYYSGFVLPHRYGLSTQNLRAWVVDLAKGGLLGIVFGTVVIEVIYFVLRTAPQWWWLLATAFMLLFSVLLANLAPVLIFPLFFKFKPLEDQELVRRLMQLAERAHTRVRGVYTMMLSEKTTAANAAFMGLGNTKRIVLGDTLYQNYTHDEIESILAHELGHQVHNDIVTGIAVETLLTIVGFILADWILRAGVGLLHLDGIADLAALPLFALALGVYGFITMPLGNAYSRWRETQADQYALETTHNPTAFIGAMEKLANQNLAELEPEPWVEFLLYDHPPIGKRLKMGEAFQTPGQAPA